MRKVRILLAAIGLVTGLAPFVGTAHADPIPCGQKIVYRQVYIGEVPCIFK